MKNTGLQPVEGTLALPHRYSSRNVVECIIQAQQDERARIGHELHDNVNQILTSAHLYMSVLNPDTVDFDHVKNKAMEILLFGIEEIRLLVRGMVMEDLKNEGLVGSIRNLINDLYVTKKFNIHFVHSELSCVERLDACKKIALFRIVQEQVKNIIKYSQAKNVEISLHCCDDQIRLQVRDDGVGFDTTSTRKGLGLSNIYERIGLYHGKVILDSAPGRGCSLIVNIPLDPASLR